MNAPLNLDSILKNFSSFGRMYLLSKEYSAKIEHKQIATYSSRLNRKIFAAPKIKVWPVVGDVAKAAAISIKAHQHLNIYKGYKAVYLY